MPVGAACAPGRRLDTIRTLLNSYAMAFTLPRVRWDRALIVALHAAAVLLFLQSIRPYYHRGTGFTELVHFGQANETRALPEVQRARHAVERDSAGYDGQWYAQLSVDPLLHSPDLFTAIDAAPYRARRIFFSWTAYLVGMGDPTAVLRAYAAQNVVVWLLLAGLLLYWLRPGDWRHLAAWAGCVFGIGLVGSVRFALIEGPGLLVIALAVVATERGRTWVASGLMAVVGLGRESNLFSAAVLADGWPRSRRDALGLAGRVALAVVPLVLWSLYVRQVFAGVPYSNYAVARNVMIPLSGYAWKWQQVFAGFWTTGAAGVPDGGSWVGLIEIVGLTVQAWYLIARRDVRSAWWRIGAAYVVLLALVGVPVWEGVPGSVHRVVLPMTVAFNILVVGSPRFWTLWALGNLPMVLGLYELGIVPFTWLW